MSATIGSADPFAFPAAAAGPAANEAPGRMRPPGGRPRRWWPWLLAAPALLVLATLVASVLLVGGALGQALGGLDIRIDGERLPKLPADEAAWWGTGIVLAVGLVVLVVLPLTVLLAVLAAALVLGAVLLALLLAAALALSPLWAVALLLWLALRPRPRPTAAAAPG